MKTKVDKFLKKKQSDDIKNPRQINPSELLVNYACLAALAKIEQNKGIFMSKKSKEKIDLRYYFKCGQQFYLNKILFEIIGIHGKTLSIRVLSTEVEEEK